jgi:glycosyltransferase involved in cell wall biosynthesis
VLPTVNKSGENRVRVVYAVPSVGDRFGGLAAAVAALGPVEAALGRRPELLTLDRPEQGTTVRAELDRWFDVRLLPPGRGPAGRYHGGVEVARSLAAAVGGADLLVLHSVFDVLSQVGHRAARRAGVPWVLWPHGSLDPVDLVKHARAKQALAPLWRSVLGGAGALLCATPAEADRLCTWGTTAPRRVVPLPHVPARVTVPLPAPVVRDGGRLVLYLGRLDPRKGLELLLDAFAAVARPADVLVLAGAGEPAYERSLRARASGQVRFPGWVTGADKAGLLAAADVLALLSERENYGYVAVEALDAGVAPLLSAEVGLAGLLGPAGAARVVPRTVAAAAAGLRGLLDDPAAAKAVVASGQGLVHDRLRPAAVARDYARVLAEVVR